MAKSFSEYFIESMSSVGLPTPSGWWVSIATASATLNGLLAAMGSIGAKATVAELIIAAEAGVGAGVSIAVAKGALVGVGGLAASFYVGACLGAFMYACQMTLVEKFSLADAQVHEMLNQARRYGIEVPVISASRLVLA